jgi:hypothetical protein
MFRMKAFHPSSILNMENVLQEVIKICKLNLGNQQAPCKFSYTSESIRGFGANFDAVRGKDGPWFRIFPPTCKSIDVPRANVSTILFFASWHFQYQDSRVWHGAYYTSVYFERLRKTTKNLSLNRKCHGRDSNPSNSRMQVYNVTSRRTRSVYRW